MRDVLDKHAAVRWLLARHTSGQRHFVVGSDGHTLFSPGAGSEQHTDRQSLRAVVDAARSCQLLLARTGVGFVFLPIPGKENVYADMVPGMRSSDFIPRLVKELQEAEVPAIDLASLYAEARRAGAESLFRADDDHRSPRAVELTAAALARMLAASAP